MNTESTAENVNETEEMATAVSKFWLDAWLGAARSDQPVSAEESHRAVAKLLAGIVVASGGPARQFGLPLTGAIVQFIELAFLREIVSLRPGQVEDSVHQRIAALQLLLSPAGSA